MEGRIVNFHLPGFVMEDLEIVLDELCAGYSEATASRLRNELVDHYQSTYENALADGLAGEAAHEKALQELGWETTLMVGRACQQMGWWSKRYLHWVIFAKDSKPKVEILFYIAVIPFLILFALASSGISVINSRLMLIVCLLAAVYVAHKAYMTRRVSRKPLPNRRKIKRKTFHRAFAKHLSWMLLFLAWFLFLHMQYPENKLIMQLVLNFGFVTFYWMLGHFWAYRHFVKAWNAAYPEDKI